jgi:hypothetical protein
VARKPLVECGFYIPIHRDRLLSDGEQHLPEVWEWLEDRLFDFGGATRGTELHVGFYVDRDTRQRVHDSSCHYVVALPRGRVRKLRALLREACREFQQKCIYLSVAGYVEFVEGRGRETR